MCFLPQDRRHLSHALKLAENSAAFASPNPAVGCVIARDDVAIGEGAHRYDARDHAEIVALKQAAAIGLSPQGATAYVSLEPCSHHGRTGPCADALIAAGIARCVVATVDPNPAVSGRGLARMRAAGIAVCVVAVSDPLAQQAQRLNDAFAFSIVQGRPFVKLKAALSVDGMIAPPASQRNATAPHWLTGEAARADVQQLRHRADAILTGIGTVLADDPSLTDRTGQPRRRPLLRVVLDSQLRTPSDASLIRSADDDVLIVCASDAPHDRELALRKRGVAIERGAQPGINLHEVLKVLASRDIRSVLIEAGSTINGSFLAAGLVDKVVFYYAETELGSDAIPFATSGASPYTLQQQLTSVERRTFVHGDAEDVRISGYLHNPWHER